MSSRTWADELRITIHAAEAGIATIGELSHYLWERLTASDCLPRVMPDDASRLLGSLMDQLETIRRSASDAFQRYSSEPVETLFLRRPLSREQYYLICAMGARPDELPPAPAPPPTDASPMPHPEAG